MEPPRNDRSGARDPRTGRLTRAERREHERFARAVDSGDDPDFAGELAVVAALRELGRDTARDGALPPAGRARVTDRVLNPAAEPEPVPDQDPESSQEEPRRKRPALATGAVAAGVVGVLGVGAAALWTADNALPGDALYGLKQLSEHTAIGLTWDDEERAYKHLGYASDRLGELTDLTSAGALDAGADADAYAEGFVDFEQHTRSAASALTDIGTSTDGSQLDRLGEWAHAQGAYVVALPPEAQELLWRVEARTTALSERLSCTQITSGERDELGALPATGACQLPLGAPNPPAAPDTDGDGDPDPGDPDGGVAAEPADPPAATLAGGAPADAASEATTAATEMAEQRPTPRWTPPEPPAAPRAALDVPEPDTGPRLPDGSADDDPSTVLGTLLSGLGGSQAVSTG
ncbi:hypothetical protein BJF85_11730 [Saccharomonospora sp. CUA-673]|uniref:DUF5667 domain-containing protein n=1 Tax=Saccharomonospora sp. CUA-673 TaxID=1904969 RepID=UPI000960D367|nr:DUF5667 domain-containing protein [Saccharomonospora sp. CUA-673]OLT48777.1 hypothetical protein BJF85_11730 [Saccharomonospora sp. CUA-673]